MRPHKARLFVETLEPRTTPATGPWTTESFDSTAIGSLPAAWQSWGSTGGSGFHVAAGRGVSGQLLASDGGSASSGRTWPAATYPRDVSVTASVLADSLVPAQLFARGTNLNGIKPSYYAVSVARGLDIKLLRMENGMPAELGTLKSNTYVSGIWFDVALTTQRNVIQARVRRRDTGEWLNAFGDWQAAPAAALTATDGRLQSGGSLDRLDHPRMRGPFTSTIFASRREPAMSPHRGRRQWCNRCHVRSSAEC